MTIIKNEDGSEVHINKETGDVRISKHPHNKDTDSVIKEALKKAKLQNDPIFTRYFH